MSQRQAGFVAQDKQEDPELLAEWLEAGNLTSVLDRTYDFEETPEAVRYVE